MLLSLSSHVFLEKVGAQKKEGDGNNPGMYNIGNWFSILLLCRKYSPKSMTKEININKYASFRFFSFSSAILRGFHFIHSFIKFRRRSIDCSIYFRLLFMWAFSLCSTKNASIIEKEPFRFDICPFFSYFCCLKLLLCLNIRLDCFLRSFNYSHLRKWYTTAKVIKSVPSESAQFITSQCRLGPVWAHYTLEQTNGMCTVCIISNETMQVYNCMWAKSKRRHSHRVTVCN